MTENYFNAYNVTLTQLTTTGTTLYVSQAAPADSGFRILIDSELMQVSAGGTTTTWTVTRNIEGTTLASHDIGSAVIVVLSAGSLDALRTQWNGIGTYANRPITGMKKGDSYTCTDSPYSFMYDGAAWQTFYGNYRVTIPPNTWSWVNQNSAAFSTTYGYTLLTQATTSSGNGGCSLIYTSVPSAPWTVIARFRTRTNLTQYHDLGVAMIRSTNGYFIGMGAAAGGPSNNYALVRCSKWSGPNTLTSNVDGDIYFPTGYEIMAKLSDTGTNVQLSYSLDGWNYSPLIYNETRATFLGGAPDGIGLFINKNTAEAATDSITLFDMTVTTP